MKVKVMDNTVKVYGMKPVKGRGAKLYCGGGRVYLDFLAGVAVNALGYNDPDINSAVISQVKKYIHTSRLFYSGPQEKLAKLITENSFGKMVYFVNSGAEANEVAIKLARKWGVLNKKGANRIITFKNSFHGRTMTTLTATGQKKFHNLLNPKMPGFVYAKYNDIKDVKSKIGKKTAAVLIEPVQAEGGVYVPSKKFLKELQKLCKLKKVLLIVDEVFTGMGRTGYLFAHQGFGIKPDIMTLGKGLGGGLPLSAVVVSPALSRVFKPGDHGTTMGGNPAACAAGAVVIKKVKKIVNKVRKNGDYFISELKKIKSPFIKEIRGKGLLVGVEVKGDASKVVEKAFKRNLIINCAKPNIIRMVPPLIVTKKEIDKAVGILKEIL